MTASFDRLINPFTFWSATVLGLALIATGCYTQMGTGYYQEDFYSQSEPEYEEITVYETEEGDSVVVDRYFTDAGLSGTRYRRYFSRFYGTPYLTYDPFYDPFWYDPFYDGWGYGRTSLHLSIGWGSPWYYTSPYYYSPYRYGWGWHRYSPYAYGYYPGYYGGYGYYPGYYGNLYRHDRWTSGHYGPRGAGIGRGGVLAGGDDRGRMSSSGDYLRTYGRSVASDRALEGSRLGVRNSAGTGGLRTAVRGRTDGEEPNPRTMSRSGVTNSGSSRGTTASRGSRITGRSATGSSTGRVSTARRNTGSNGGRVSSNRPTTRSTARPSSSTRPTSRARPSSSTRPTSRARPSSST
ncbi:MAG: hypothetical protein OXU68_11080, partial [Bacteroidota bacterium]|nr:hypothetical protein [Bacteroidota bacterium]